MGASFHWAILGVMVVLCLGGAYGFYRLFRFLTQKYGEPSVTGGDKLSDPFVLGLAYPGAFSLAMFSTAAYGFIKGAELCFSWSRPPLQEGWWVALQLVFITVGAAGYLYILVGIILRAHVFEHGNITGSPCIVSSEQICPAGILKWPANLCAKLLKRKTYRIDFDVPEGSECKKKSDVLVVSRDLDLQQLPESDFVVFHLYHFMDIRAIFLEDTVPDNSVQAMADYRRRKKGGSDV
jgi:hypothetical protein